MAEKWSSYQGVPFKDHLYVADQQKKEEKKMLPRILFIDFLSKCCSKTTFKYNFNFSFKFWWPVMLSRVARPLPVASLMTCPCLKKWLYLYLEKHSNSSTNTPLRTLNLNILINRCLIPRSKIIYVNSSRLTISL